MDGRARSDDECPRDARWAGSRGAQGRTGQAKAHLLSVPPAWPRLSVDLPQRMSNGDHQRVLQRR